MGAVLEIPERHPDIVSSEINLEEESGQAVNTQSATVHVKGKGNQNNKVTKAPAQRSGHVLQDNGKNSQKTPIHSTPPKSAVAGSSELIEGAGTPNNNLFPLNKKGDFDLESFTQLNTSQKISYIAGMLIFSFGYSLLIHTCLPINESICCTP